ncbi:hypothetical protein L13192_12833 [Pyrenophora tritici-repentis]|nr:hypothetical protein L13192_12833 [Pyrenophora tritici-repentis]
MPSHAFLSSLAVLTTLASAAPSMRSPLMQRQDTSGPENCGPTTEDGQVYFGDLGFYSDRDCINRMYGLCLYTFDNVANGQPGDYSCNPIELPSETPFWAKVEDSPFDQMQMVFTRDDKTCTPNGATFATMIDNGNCVEFNIGGPARSFSAFPHGGSGVSRRALPASSHLTKRTPNAPSTTESVQISNIVDCTNGTEDGCPITVGSEEEKSVTTSYSLTAGGGIEGLFSIETTFGMEYTESTTTSIQEGFSVSKGQKGYLSAYSAATLFKGVWTDCDEGDVEQPGEALVIKENGFTYSIVNTGI